MALALPRLGVGREIIGQWESLLYVGYVLGFGWLTGLLQAYLVTVKQQHPQLMARYSRTALWGVMGFSALLLAVAAGLHQPLFRLLRLGEVPPGWLYFFTFLLVQWPGLFFEQVLLARERPWPLILFSGASGLGLVLALLLPFHLGYSLPEALAWLAVVAAVKAAVILIWLWQDRRVPVSTDSRLQTKDSRLLATARPLIAYASVGALVTAFDPWFVNYWYGGDEAVFAIFRYGARELPLLAALTNGLIIAVLPRLSEDLDGGLRLLKDGSRRLYHWVFTGAAFLMLSSNYFWVLVFTSEFSESLILFQIGLLSVFSQLLFPMPVIVSLHKTKWLALFSLSELLSKLILVCLLVNMMSLEIIVFITFLADLSNKILLIAYLYVKGLKPQAYMDIKIYLMYLIAILSLLVFTIFF